MNLTQASRVCGTANEKFASIRISQLRSGVALRAPIYDAREDLNLLLLASGTTITPGILAQLQRRGVTQARVAQCEVSRITSWNGQPSVASPAPSFRLRQGTAELPSPERGGCPAKTFPPNSFLHTVQQHAGKSHDQQKVAKFSAGYQVAISQIKGLFDRLLVGNGADGNAVSTVSCDALTRMSEDIDLFVTLGITPNADAYPYNHSLQTAMLAMAIGAVMGLRQDDLMQLGMGCLVHDAGMLKMKRSVLECDTSLGTMEFLEVTKHPTITFELVQEVKELSTGSRMVAYQMHERWNGSGYPRKRQGKQIHPFARIAAVADVFVALISPRRHRQAMLAAQAMTEVIRGVPAGLYDRDVVRGLLHVVSLFPLGSYVETNDNRVGRVVRSNGSLYTQPTVELWLPERMDQEPEVVDLSRETELRITRTLAELPVWDF